MSNELNEQKTQHPGKDKEQIIYVNTREFPWTEKEISFKQVVELAYPNAVFSPQIVYTVSYSKGEDKKPKGDMVDGSSVHVKNGMVFDVDKADNS